jgi:hypothetical protein
MSDNEGGCDIAAAGLLIADGLNDQNFGVRDLAEERAHVIQVTDARAAFCQLVLSTTGHLTFDYLPFTGRATSPAALAGIIAAVLGHGPAQVPAGAWPGPTLLGAAGRLLRSLGLHVTLGPAGPNNDFCEVHTHLTITSPDHPTRGTVSLSDDAMVVWECRLGPPAGLDAPDIAAAIGSALSRLQYPGHPGPATSRHLATA